jgi:hypothetical protein
VCCSIVGIALIALAAVLVAKSLRSAKNKPLVDLDDIHALGTADPGGNEL